MAKGRASPRPRARVCRAGSPAPPATARPRPGPSSSSCSPGCRSDRTYHPPERLSSLQTSGCAERDASRLLPPPVHRGLLHTLVGAETHRTEGLHPQLPLQLGVLAPGGRRSAEEITDRAPLGALMTSAVGHQRL